LEEKRDRESWKRDAELQELKQQNKQLTSKMNQHESFIRELRSTYMSRNGKGKLLPQTRGRGHVRQR
jgi:vacuolar-type H+-ATPase subunit I/STV1